MYIFIKYLCLSTSSSSLSTSKWTTSIRVLCYVSMRYMADNCNREIKACVRKITSLTNRGGKRCGGGEEYFKKYMSFVLYPLFFFLLYKITLVEKCLGM